MPSGSSIEADMLADMVTFLEAPLENYSFDINRFLRKLPAVEARDMSTQGEDMCLIVSLGFFLLFLPLPNLILCCEIYL